MSKWLPIVLALCALPAHAQFKAEYDRFKDKTLLWAPPLEVFPKGRIEPQAFTNFPGKSPVATPPSVAIAFRTISPKGWQFLKCHHTNALVDGKPFALPEATHSGDSLEGSQVQESVRVILDWKDFVKVASAQTVEFRICNTELKITAKRLADWRALVAAGTPGAPAK